MTPEQFCYWMQGFAELSDGPPTPAQWQSMREHLQLVFTKMTPQVNDKPTMFDMIHGQKPREVPEKNGPGWPTIAPKITC